MHYSQLTTFTAFNACNSHLKGFASFARMMTIKRFRMQDETVRGGVIPVFIPIFDFRKPGMFVTCCNEKGSGND